MNIQNFLHLERERQGLSRKEVAEKAKCTPRAIELWEKDQRSIKLAYAERILDALGFELTVVNKKNKKKIVRYDVAQIKGTEEAKLLLEMGWRLLVVVSTQDGIINVLGKEVQE